MSLIKRSPKKSEMSAGKGDQSLAIAYEVQRKNKRKMAKGGEVEPKESLGSAIGYPGYPKPTPSPVKKANGGMIDKPSSIAEAIMRKRRGDEVEDGQVDLDWNAEEHPNYFDDLNIETAAGEDYAEEGALDQLEIPMDSNLHGDEIDSDDHDMVSQIRKKMKSRGV